MLNLNPQFVREFITRAHEFQTSEQSVIPEMGDDPADDGTLRVLADQEDDLTVQELKSMVDDLEPDQQVSLVALMWLGRGDFDAADWQSALDEAGKSWTPRTADYLIGTPLVADYLAEGLSELDYSPDE